MESIPIRLSVFAGLSVATFFLALKFVGFLIFLILNGRVSVSSGDIIVFVAAPTIFGVLTFIVVEIVQRFQHQRTEKE